MKPPHPGLWAERACFGLALVLIAACLFWGGGSRVDIPGLIFLQPLAVVICGALILVSGEMRWEAVRVPLLLLAALALVMLVQLVPLPPMIWRALPGHAQYVPFIEAVGTGSVWRPLSLTPDLTLAALMGLAVPAAGLIAFASISEKRSHQLLPYLLLAAALSAIIGIGQLAGGQSSAFYRYAVTNAGAAVGLFANRNHQGLFIAMTWPMLALWVSARGLDPQQRRLRRWAGAVGALALIPLALATGSRSGLILSVVGISFGAILLRGQSPERRAPFITFSRATVAALAVFGIAIAGLLSMLFSRDEAIQRLVATNVAEEQRWAQLPTLLRLTGDFLPFGSGFGSFDPVFRHYELDALLKPTYLNHAHNDWLELVTTGGLPAALVGLLFMIWVINNSLQFKARLNGSIGDRFANLAIVMIMLALLASVSDYPLRTPLHALLFAFACGWLAAPRAERGRLDRA